MRRPKNEQCLKGGEGNKRYRRRLTNRKHGIAEFERKQNKRKS